MTTRSRFPAPALPRLNPVACVVASLFGLVGLPAHSQESTAATPAGAALHGVTITGSLSAKPVTPATQQTLQAEQIADTTNVVNTEDALKYQPSLQIRKRFEGDRNGIVASRSSGTLVSARSLVYADGILLSNLLGNRYDFPPRWGLVTPEEIERISVMYGPYSAAYPGNSMGAVIEMTTRMPTRFEAHAKAQLIHQDFELYGRKSSLNGQQASASLGSRDGGFAWFLNLDRLDNHSQPMSYATATRSTTAAQAGDTVVSGAASDLDPSGKNRVVFGATGIDHTRQDTAKLKLAYDFDSTTRLAYTLGYWTNRSEGTTDSFLLDAAGNTVWVGSGTGTSKFVNIDGQRYTLNTNAFQPSLGDQTHLAQGLTLQSAPTPQWRVEAALSRYRYLSDGNRTPSSLDYATAQSTGGVGQIARQDGTGWRTLDLRARWRPAGNGHVVSFGLHHDRYELDSAAYATSGDWRSGDAIGALKSGFGGQTGTEALYAEDAWRFAPDFRLTGGLRWEHWQASNGTINGVTPANMPTRTEVHGSPKLSLAWEPAGEWSARASVGRAWRMPTVSELFQGSLNASQAIINNDPNLKPERGTSVELAAVRQWGDNQLRVSLFRDDARDALYSQTSTTGTQTVTMIQNVDLIRTKGIETAWDLRNAPASGFDLSGSLTWADSVIAANDKNPATVGKQQPRVPTWRASLVGTWRPAEAWALTLAGRYSSKQYGTLDNSDTNGATYLGVSGFTVFDARVRYKVDRHWSAALGVNNLGNTRYYVAHPYPQRTVVADLKYDF